MRIVDNFYFSGDAHTQNKGEIEIVKSKTKKNV